MQGMQWLKKHEQQQNQNPLQDLKMKTLLQNPSQDLKMETLLQMKTVQLNLRQAKKNTLSYPVLNPG